MLISGIRKESARNLIVKSDYICKSVRFAMHNTILMIDQLLPAVLQES